MRTLLFFFLALITTNLIAQRIKVIEVNDFEQYEEILQIAKNTDQLLFAIVKGNGNELNDMIANDVFSANGLQDKINSMIPCIMSVTNDMGTRFAQSFAPMQFPAIYIMNNEELVLAKTEGQISNVELQQAIAKANKNRSAYPAAKQAYLNNELSKQSWQVLLEVHSYNNPFVETQVLAFEYLASLNNTQRLEKENIPVLIEYGITLESDYPTMVWKNKATIKQRYAAFDESAFFESVYGYNVNLAVFNEDSLLLQKLINTWVPNTQESTPLLLALETYKHYAEETGNFNYYVVGVNQYVNESDSALADTAEFFYDEAFYIADNYASASAQKAARTLSLKALTYNVDFRYQMLAGYMSYLLKEYDAAEQQVMKAKTISELQANTRKADSLLDMIIKEKNKASGPIKYER